MKSLGTIAFVTLTTFCAPVFAQQYQYFPAGRGGAGSWAGPKCPSGSSMVSQGVCKSDRSNYQFFKAGMKGAGSWASQSSCPMEASYVGAQYCRIEY